MTNKIDSLGTVIISLGSAGKAAAGQSASTAVASAAPAAPADKLSLTGTAVRMQQLAETVSNGPQVDTKRVATLKSAVASGNYKVDARSVASKLSRFEWEMQP